MNVWSFTSFFNVYSVSYQNDAYSNSASRVLNDTGFGSHFTFNITGNVSIDAYFGIDFYGPRMYPKGCKIIAETTTRFETNATVRIFRNSVFLKQFIA